jgi:Holliday junction resolvasome RuvABC ATP-dependent DNA helicase subunit
LSRRQTPRFAVRVGRPIDFFRIITEFGGINDKVTNDALLKFFVKNAK